MTGEPAVWVYAVMPAELPPPSGTGVDGRPVRRLTRGDLAAVVGTVGWTDPAELDRRLRQPVGLEELARAHHAVVTACFQAGPTAPFRLATLYHGDEGVREMLAERHKELAAALDTVDGRAEWGVQAYAVTPEDPTPPEADPGDTAGPGTAYLLRQRGRRAARERAERVAREAAARIDGALATAAVAVCPHPTDSAIQRPGAPGALLLNMSYLVEDRERETFRATVERLARRHAEVRLRLTGPWPAYSFVEIGGSR